MEGLVGMTTYLALGICPEFHDHSDQIVESSVGPLVRQDSGNSSKGDESQSSLHTPVQCGAGDEAQRPLPGQHEYPYHKIDAL
jgi:hypothetical protein